MAKAAPACGAQVIAGVRLHVSRFTFRVLHTDKAVERRIANRRFLYGFQTAGGSRAVAAAALFAIACIWKFLEGDAGFIEGLVVGVVLGLFCYVASTYFDSIKAAGRMCERFPSAFSDIAVDADGVDITTEEARVISLWSTFINLLEGDGYMILVMRGAWIAMPTVGVDPRALDYIRQQSALQPNYRIERTRRA